jgi:uncharacterized SAM-binding protein YcdF (DUF218 family)
VIATTHRMVDDITEFIFVADAPQAADIIFLPGGSFPEPAEHAARLYRRGLAPYVLPSGGVSVKTGAFDGVKSKQDRYNQLYGTDCAFYTDVLLQNGVAENAILREDKSGFTKENALFSRKLCDKKKLRIRKGLIVCKSFHARRCLMLYQLAFPEAELICCPVDVANIRRDNWHTFEYGIDRVFGELARCGNQFVPEMKKYLI